MQFTPKTEDEIASENLLADGVYGFEIIEAEDTISKSSGKDMIAVRMKVFDGEGGFRFVNDYLLEAILYKVKHCADACGLAAEYARGQLHGADLIGKTGEVKIVTQQDKDKMYPPKNVVRDYVVPKENNAPPAHRTPARKPAMTSTADDPFGDDIPF
jgi:hypothetical protein